jgi:hypothetical protein
MALYEGIDANPKLLPVDLARPLLPGTFEHVLNHLLNGPIDPSSFDDPSCERVLQARSCPWIWT